MQKTNFKKIDGTEFPAGRKTRVLIGESGAIKNLKFAQGFVEIYPGGSVPMHKHSNQESYTILKGKGEITLDDEKTDVVDGDVILIPPNTSHELVNTGDENMYMMFVYTPGNIVDHWQEELEK